MKKVTLKELESLIRMLNKALSRPLEPYTRIDGVFHANIGNFHLSQAYGGVCVEEMVSESGGVRAPFGLGHVPKRECALKLRAALAALELKKDV